MSQELLRDIFSFLEETRPGYGTPSLVVLGGSQTTDGGIHKTTTSDYDILIFFKDIDRPESFSFTSTDGQRKYDIILRDAKTFAYDINSASDNGRGTLLHIVTNGIALYDPRDIHPAFLTHLQPFYRRGPSLPHLRDYKGEVAALRKNLHQISDIPDGTTFTAALLALVNRIAKDVLHYAGEWTSTGKIAGRFLHQKMPAFKGGLERSFQQAVKNHDVTPFETVILSQMAEYYFRQVKNGRPVAPEQPVHPFRPDEADFGVATTLCRLNLDAFATYLQGDAPIAHNAAVTWVHCKADTTRRPIEAERYSRPSGEYFYALGRGIATLSDIYAASQHKQPSHLSMTERIVAYMDAHPQSINAITGAMQGHPYGIQELFTMAVHSCHGQPAAHAYRPSREDMIGDPSIVLPSHLQF